MSGEQADPTESPAESTAEVSQPRSGKKPAIIWHRLGYMLLIVLIYGVTRAVVALTVLIQIVAQVFSGKPNRQLIELGESLATYSYQIIRYLTFATENRPYPFDETWPDGSPSQVG